MMVTRTQPRAKLDQPALPNAAARVEGLEAALGVQFADRSILLQALLHRSAVLERQRNGAVLPTLPSNERMEFLGDAVLSMLVAHYVYDAFPDFGEGQLTEARAALVRRSTLAILAENLGLGNHIYMGRSEQKEGGRGRTTVLAEALEAVVAAVFLDQGLEVARALVARLLDGRVPALLERAGALNPKSQLQELAQIRMRVLPSYRVLGRTGPAHDSRFAVEVQVGNLRAAGSGSSRRAAEQDAARSLLREMETLPDPDSLDADPGLIPTKERAWHAP